MPLTETGSDQLVRGVDGIAAGLADIPVPVDVIVARARNLAPVDTGNLSRSIRGRTDAGTSSVGSPVAYGLPVHFGVPSRGQRPRPFLHQAVTAETARVVAQYTDDVAALIERNV